MLGVTVSASGEKNQEIFGSDIKLLLTVAVEGVSMSSVDFDVIFKSGNKSLTLNKQALVQVDDENYIVCIKSPNTDVGDLMAEVHLQIPDENFEGNICNKIKRINTGIQIIK